MTGLKQTLRSRRGFTLVELIVVLVILGVVAAFAVPALTGYIDTAHEKQAVSEAQACVATATDMGARQYAAAQQYNLNASMSGSNQKDDLYGWSPANSTTPTITDGDVVLTEGTGQYRLHVKNPPRGSFPMTGIGDVISQMQTQAGVSGTINRLTFNSSGQLLYLVYTSKGGIQVVYTNTGSTTSVDIGSSEAVVVPTPKKDDSSGGDSGGGGTGGGGTGGGETPGGEDTETPTLTVTIRKVDADDQSGLPNAQLQILKDSTVVKEITSSAGGNPVKLEAGSYTLHESTAPSGYNTAADISFTIVKSGTALTLQVDSGVRGENDTIIMQDTKTRLDVPTFGDLRFTFADYDDNNVKISGIKFKLERLGDSSEFGTRACVIDDNLTTNDSGTINIPVYNPASGYFLEHPEDSAHAAADYCMYRLTATSYPEGRQEVFSIQFQISPADKKTVWNADTKKTDVFITDYNIGADFSTNENPGNYGSHITDTDDPHHLTYFNKAVPYLTIRLLNKSTGENLSGSAFKIIIGEQTVLTSSTTMSYRAALKIHPGDHIKKDDPYIEEYSMVTLQELASPLGYDRMPNVTFQIKRTGLENLRIDNVSDLSLYAEIDKEPLTLNLYNLQTSSVTIRKIDDARELLTGASLRLTTKDGGILDDNKVPQTSKDFSDFAGLATVILQPGTYTLEETKVPADYTVGTNTYSYQKAPNITFTIKAGQTNGSISMLNHTVGKSTSDITIKDDNVSIQFPNATNWSKKLTQDDSVKINREVLFWQGKYYYCIPKLTSGVPNADRYKKYWKDSALDLNSEFDLNSPDGLNQHNGTKYIAPDPISYCKLVIDPLKNTNYSDQIVLLTEKIWTETSIQTVSATNPIRQGDLYVYQDRVYLYYGKANLSKAPKGQPNSGTNDTIWNQLDTNKAKILTTAK